MDHPSEAQAGSIPPKQGPDPRVHPEPPPPPAQAKPAKRRRLRARRSEVPPPPNPLKDLLPHRHRPTRSPHPVQHRPNQRSAGGCEPDEARSLHRQTTSRIRGPAPKQTTPLASSIAGNTAAWLAVEVPRADRSRHRRQLRAVALRVVALPSAITRLAIPSAFRQHRSVVGRPFPSLSSPRTPPPPTCSPPESPPSPQSPPVDARCCTALPRNDARRSSHAERGSRGGAGCRG